MARLGERDKKKLYYKLYAGRTEKLDSSGNKTGKYAVAYSDMKSMRASISANKGASSVEMFGNELGYTKTVITDDMLCPLNEQSVLWVDVPTTGPYDYIVVAVARGLTNISYAIRKVEQ